MNYDFSEVATMLFEQLALSRLGTSDEKSSDAAWALPDVWPVDGNRLDLHTMTLSAAV